MTRKCIIFEPIGLCTNVIDDPENTYTPDYEFSIAPDNTGEIGWTWDGDQWINPNNVVINAYLGQSPSAETPDLTDESNRLATTFYVRQKIEDYINNVFLTNFVLDGGTFDDAAPLTSLDAGYFNNTGSNLLADVSSPLFDNSNGNLTSDIDGGSF